MIFLPFFRGKMGANETGTGCWQEYDRQEYLSERIEERGNRTTDVVRFEVHFAKHGSKNKWRKLPACDDMI
jgi:hypothetical protein